MYGAPLWTGSLVGILPRLKTEARERPGRWACRMLRGGALIACRMRDDLGYDVRIARPGKPATDDGWRRWRNEIDVFRRELGIQRWTVDDDPDAPGVAVIFSEPAPPRRPGEVLPGDLPRRAPSAIEQGG